MTSQNVFPILETLGKLNYKVKCIFCMVGGGCRGTVIGRIPILPIFAVIILSTIGYQEVYGISYTATLGISGVPGTDNDHFRALIGTAVDLSGNIYVADEDSHRIQIFNSARVYQFTIGVPGVQGSGNDHFRFPAGVAVDSVGNIYVSDTDNHRVQKFNSAGAYQSTIGVSGVAGSNNAHFNLPAGIAIDKSNNIYVVDSVNHRVQKFNSTGAYQLTINVSGIPNEEEAGVAVDSVGNIYVSDTDNHRVQKFNSAGVYQSTIGVSGVAGSDDTHFDSPAGVAVDKAGNIYVADRGNFRVQIFDSAGVLKSTIGETGVIGSDNAHFSFPSGIAVDSSGNIYVGDSFNFRVQIFSLLDTPNFPPGHSRHSSDDPPPSRIKPSFGGVGNMVFPDGLTLDNKVYSLNNFKVDIPQTIADIGQNITIKIKEQLSHGPTDWKYVAIYMDFEDKDPETYNANLVLSNDKDEGQKLFDPKGYISYFNATTSLDSTYVYTTFSFTAAKAMPDSRMIVSAWDGHNRINNVYVGGAIQFGQNATVVSYHLPDWIHEYTNFHDASVAVENAGYQKPSIFGHMANSDQIWKGSDGGSLKWFLDDAKETASIVIYGSNGNVVSERTESLKKIDSIYSKCTDGKTCVYSWSNQGQLSRTDAIQLEKVKKSEEDRVSTVLQNMGYTQYFDHNQAH